jgi:hypothetical protein
MEELNISAAAVATHVLITWIPWIIGIVVGGGLGVLCGLGIRAFFSARPALRHPLLLPWRTFVTGLFMVVCSPFIVRILGIGPIAGGVMVGASVCLLAMAFTATMLVEHWHLSPLGAQLIGGARTLAMASGLIAVGVSLMGGGGLGQVILGAARLPEYDLWWKGLSVVLALALGLDLALGIAQLITLQHSGDSGEAVIAEGENHIQTNSVSFGRL